MKYTVSIDKIITTTVIGKLLSSHHRWDWLYVSDSSSVSIYGDVSDPNSHMTVWLNIYHQSFWRVNDSWLYMQWYHGDKTFDGWLWILYESMTSVGLLDQNEIYTTITVHHILFFYIWRNSLAMMWWLVHFGQCLEKNKSSKVWFHSCASSSHGIQSIECWSLFMCHCRRNGQKVHR